MSNTFELNEKLGFSPPVQFDNNLNQGFFQTGFVELNKLIPRIKKGSFTFIWSQFLTGQITKLETKDSELERYITNPRTKKPANLHFIKDEVDKPYIDGRNQYYFKTILSTSKKTISTRRVEFSYNINIEDNFYKYRILFPFNEYRVEDSLPNKYAIIIESNNFFDLSILLRDLNIGFPLSLKTEIKRIFQKAFDNTSAADSDRFDQLYQYAPSFVIEGRGIKTLIANIRSILNKPVNESGTNEEIAVLNILRALYNKSETNDDFLTLLIYKFGPNRVPLYQILKRLDGQYLVFFCQFIQDVWKESSYKSIKNKVYTDSNCPPFLPYRSDKTLGFYHSNIDTSFIKGKTIDVVYDTGEFDPENSSINTVLPVVETKKENYQCHQFFPIKVPSGQKGEIEISNEIPAFMLYVKENSDFWNNVYQGIGLGVDILTTLSGFGNITKFRHLARLAQRASRLRFAQNAAVAAKTASNINKVAAVVEISSGSLNILLKLSELDQSQFGKDVSQFLFFLELLSLGGELTNLIDHGARRFAKRIVKNENKLRKELKKIVSTKNSEYGNLDADNLIQELKNIAGNSKMSFASSDPIKVKEFAEGLKSLSKIKPEEAFENLYDALKYFNHKIEDGVIKKVSNNNCVNVVQAVDHFLKTGEIRVAEKFVESNKISVLEIKYQETSKLGFLRRTIKQLKFNMKEGETGIIFGNRGPIAAGHVINVIKKNGKLHLVDGQSGTLARLDDPRYISFHYLRTN